MCLIKNVNENGTITYISEEFIRRSVEVVQSASDDDQTPQVKNARKFLEDYPEYMV